MEEFLSKVKEQFEDSDMENIQMDTVFRTLETWDSLTAMALQAMVLDDYGVKITNKELLDLDTVGDLYEFIESKR